MRHEILDGVRAPGDRLVDHDRDRAWGADGIRDLWSPFGDGEVLI